MAYRHRNDPNANFSTDVKKNVQIFGLLLMAQTAVHPLIHDILKGNQCAMLCTENALEMNVFCIILRMCNGIVLADEAHST